MKTAKWLVEYAKAQVGRPYWFGTFGQLTTEKLWNDKAKQYKNYYSDKRKAVAIPAQLNKKAHDCIGLSKGALWCSGVDSAPVYKSSEDWSADVTYSKATVKGPIATLPERPGVCLWRKGHWGVYIGGGKLVEAKGFDYGVVISEVSKSTFTNWCEHPLFDYAAQNDTAPAPSAPVAPTAPAQPVNVYTVVKGDTLTKIAKKFGTTVNKLVELNGIKDPNKIAIGQRLRFAAPTDKTPESVQIWNGYINTVRDPLRVRKTSNPNSEVLRLIPRGSTQRFKGVAVNGMYQLADGSGWCSASLVKKV